MKFRILVPALILAVFAFAPAAMAATWATSVEDFLQGTKTYYDVNREDPLKALHAADDSGNSSDTDFFSLGNNGHITLSFGTAFTGDVLIYEATYDRDDRTEYALVSFSKDNVNWTNAVLIDNQNVDVDGAYTLSLTDNFRYIRIEDATLDNGGDTGDGFDLDAVSVQATPIPGAAWLLGTGLLGLVGLRRKRRG